MTRLAPVVNVAALVVAGLGFELGAALFQPRWYGSMALHTVPPGVSASSLDRRTPIAVVADVRRTTGQRAYPLPSRPTVADIADQAGGDRRSVVRPLAGVSRVLTLLCSERGPYQRYDSDRFGFNNPDSMWDRPVDVAILGDSFVQGNCVAPDSTIAADLNRHGVPSIGLGVSGNGPLSLLAELREYARRARPKVVVWTYYEGNDLCDLDEELRDPALTAYRDASHSQRLVERQPEIDSLLRTAYDRQIARFTRLYGARLWTWRSVLTLSQTRSLIRDAITRRRGREPTGCRALGAFRDILALAKRETSDLGDSLLFVYLPSSRPAQNDMHRAAIAAHDTVLSVIRSLGVAAIDLTPELTSRERAASVWNFPTSHYTATGYGLVAKAIESARGVATSVEPSCCRRFR